MRRFGTLVLSLAAAALVAGPAAAQRPMFPGGGFGQINPVQMLNAKKVQEELKLTEDQVKKIADTRKEVQDKYKEETEKIRDIKDRREQFEKRAELQKKINEETMKALSGVIKEEQTKRLEQIRVQLLGVGAFSNEEIQKKLKIEDDQKADIKKISEDVGKDIQGLFQGAFTPGTFPDQAKMQEMMKKTQDLNKEALAKVLKVLGDDQKKTWKEMTGEPTSITAMDLMGARPPMRDARPPARDTEEKKDK